MSFIQCSNLIKIHKTAELEVVALRGVDLTVGQGEIVAIVGVSGSGKSTLLNILGGLDVPSAGEVQVGQYNLTQMSALDCMMYRRREVGFVWQQPGQNLLPYLSIQKNVELPMLLNGQLGRQVAQRAEELLAIVGLADRTGHFPRQLSGGQQQRAAIAVAMANQPRLILADEPTGQVDSAMAASIYDVFEILQQREGVTVVLVTHDLSITERMKCVLEMSDGRLSNTFIRQGTAIQQYALVDRGGRLQIPDEYLETLNIHDDIELHVHPDHIRIYSAAG